MEEIDMSRPGAELFPEVSNQDSSYAGYTGDHEAGGSNDSGVAGDVADQQQPSQQEINWKAAREELARMKEESMYWKGQAEALSRQASPVVNEPPKEDPFTNIHDDDVRSALHQMRSEFQDKLAAVETKAQRPDWNNLVKEHVPQLTNRNPIFAEMIQNASNPYEAAYLLAELAKGSSAQQAVASQPMVSSNAQRALENAQKPASVSTIGGKGSLSQADMYASMSDEDFMKLASRNLAGI